MSTILLLSAVVLSVTVGVLAGALLVTVVLQFLRLMTSGPALERTSPTKAAMKPGSARR